MLRHTHFGEGQYDETEQVLQQLLKESGTQVTTALAQVALAGFVDNQAPETYVGTGRRERFLSPEKVHTGTAQQYSFPTFVPLHTFAASGQWTFQDEFAQTGAEARLRLHFNAKDVYLVMSSEQSAPVEVQLLGAKPPSNHSEDVNAQGQITVGQSRLYHLVQLDKGQEGTVELRFSQPGVKVYAFTFGG